MLAMDLCASPTTGAAAAAPRTVLDYYLLLPAKYLGGLGTDSRAERLRLLHDSKGSFVDVRNGYLHVAGAGAQRDLHVCIFRRPDQTYLAPVNANADSSSARQPFPDL